MSASGAITAFGAALAHLRLERATIAEAMGWANPATAKHAAGARAACNWDEDAITLAVAAARSALAAVESDAHASAREGARAKIDALVVASTTLPFADRDAAALVAAALDLRPDIETLTVGSSMRAGVTALLGALRGSDARTTLVVASDARRTPPGSAQELADGHGAAAFLVSAGNGADASAPLIRLRGSASRAANFVDHYRAAPDGHDYSLEERWVRTEGHLALVPETITRALADAGIEAAAVNHFVAPMSAGTTRRIAAAAGLGDAQLADTLANGCGETGAAHPLLMLAATLEQARPGETIVVVGFGQGVDVLVLEAGAGLEGCATRPVAVALSAGAAEPSYTRYLSHSGALAVDFGMRAERDQRSAHTVAWRKARELDGFIGGQCSACGTVQYPRFRVCVNPQCRRTDTLEDHPLADTRGRVKTFTEDWQAYTPRPPYIYGNIELEGGGNLLMELTDVDAGELAVGDVVRFVYRVKDYDTARGFRRYFWKAVRS